MENEVASTCRSDWAEKFQSCSATSQISNFFNGVNRRKRNKPTGKSFCSHELKTNFIGKFFINLAEDKVYKWIAFTQNEWIRNNSDGKKFFLEVCSCSSKKSIMSNLRNIVDIIQNHKTLMTIIGEAGIITAISFQYSFFLKNIIISNILFERRNRGLRELFSRSQESTLAPYSRKEWNHLSKNRGPRGW